VPALAARGGRRQLDGARRGGPRLGHGATELERPRVGRVGEREAWVGRDGPPERLLRATLAESNFSTASTYCSLATADSVESGRSQRSFCMATTTLQSAPQQFM